MEGSTWQCPNHVYAFGPARVRKLTGHGAVRARDRSPDSMAPEVTISRVVLPAEQAAECGSTHGLHPCAGHVDINHRSSSDGGGGYTLSTPPPPASAGQMVPRHLPCGNPSTLWQAEGHRRPVTRTRAVQKCFFHFSAESTKRLKTKANTGNCNGHHLLIEVPALSP
ncbi:Pentatricopeptide repeat-containing protein [Zea mays]|uniref:Pentatricopeptide repeat-containing protein n=1 Tax=Zea mays TaxID=4577 RepID=A0A1D6LE25_MAIZE|nr:Pentatricopeptide repeat-containing protein [Zea mays]